MGPMGRILLIDEGREISHLQFEMTFWSAEGNENSGQWAVGSGQLWKKNKLMVDGFDGKITGITG